MANRLFGSIPANRPKSNAFDLSHLNHLTANFGELIPVLCEEVVPGDKFKIKTEALVRMAPMLAPVMANMDCYIHYFFVPNRLIWHEWEDFMTGTANGEDSSDFIPPFIRFTDGFVNLYFKDSSSKVKSLEGTLLDYLGIPELNVGSSTSIYPTAQSGNSFSVSSLPFRAYNLIYEEYYRDELLNGGVTLNYADGGYEALNSVAEGTGTNLDQFIYLKKRAWGKDYLTSARPQPALGGDVLMPVGTTFSSAVQGTVNISGTGIVDVRGTSANPFYPKLLNYDYSDLPIGAGGTDQALLWGPDHNSSTFNAINQGMFDVDNNEFYSNNGPIVIDPNGSMKVDGSDFTASPNLTASGSITAGTIRDLNRAIQLQKFNERSSVAGNRYIEFIKAHFGVVSSDARLQRPQYIGGTKTPIMISEVLQTSGSDYAASSGSTPTPQGTMAGHGMGVAKSRSYKFFAEEYGFIMGIMSILPKTSYQQGVSRMFTRFDRFDYYIPEFANIGEQSINNYEVYTKLDNSNDEYGTFGYQSRYAEYKFGMNETHGEFRSSLSYWHLGRIFASRPYLNVNFVSCNGVGAGYDDSLNRIFAVQSNDYDHFYVQLYHDVKAIRRMPKFGAFSL